MQILCFSEKVLKHTFSVHYVWVLLYIDSDYNFQRYFVTTIDKDCSVIFVWALATIGCNFMNLLIRTDYEISY